MVVKRTDTPSVQVRPIHKTEYGYVILINSVFTAASDNSDDIPDDSVSIQQPEISPLNRVRHSLQRMVPEILED